jgi:hypothetical protein
MQSAVEGDVPAVLSRDVVPDHGVMLGNREREWQNDSGIPGTRLSPTAHRQRRASDRALPGGRAAAREGCRLESLHRNLQRTSQRGLCHGFGSRRIHSPSQEGPIRHHHPR